MTLQKTLTSKVERNRNRALSNSNDIRRIVSAVSKKVDKLWTEEGCPSFVIGHILGENGEIFEGRVSSSTECIKICIERKKTYPDITGVLISSSNYCYCLGGRIARQTDVDTDYKHCKLR